MIPFGNSKALMNYANVSYFIRILSEAQIKLPKPVLTYVLAQCLTNLELEFQEKPRCSTCLKIKSRL